MHRKQLLTFITYTTYAIFFVPLIVLPNTFIFPFIFPKIVVFRSLTLLLALGYILLLATGSRVVRIRWTPTTLAVLLFLVSMAVSTFVGIDWYRSFWDGHERMLGLFTLVHYGLFYIVLTHVFRTEKQWLSLARIFLLAGSLVMVVAFVQKYIDVNAVINQGSDRVHGTLGNPIYLSGYGLFLLSMGIFSFLKSPKWSLWYWVSICGGILGFLGIFWGGTRGALLGLLVGMGVALVLYGLFLRGHRQARKVILSIILVLLSIISTLYVFRHTAFVQEVPAVGRLVSTDIRGGTANTRFMAWEIALESWKKYPVFGWGPNNFFYAFNEFYKPEFLKYGYGETWFDNAHNVFMNTLTTQGVVGIIAYLSLFIVSLVMLLRAYRRDRIGIHVFVLMSSFLVAHFVALLTVFEDPTSYLYFFFVLALINSLSTTTLVEAEETAKQQPVSMGFFITMIVVIGIFLYATNINPARANTRALSTLRLLQTDPQRALAEVDNLQSAAPTPHIDDIRNDFARSATVILRNPKGRTQAWWGALLEKSISVSEMNLDLHPRDIRVHIVLSDLYTLAYQKTQNSAFLNKAEDILRDALLLSPERQQLEYTLASTLQIKGDIDGAIHVLEESIDHYDKVGDGWWRLALLYVQKGDTKKAVGIAQNVLEKDDVHFSQDARNTLQNIVTTYSSSQE